VGAIRDAVDSAAGSSGRSCRGLRGQYWLVQHCHRRARRQRCCLRTHAGKHRATVALNGFEDRVEVHQIGLGSQAGHATLELSDFNQGDHRMVAQTSGRKETVEVEIRTLDSVLNGRRPALIKLDTQGSEVAILEGGRAAWAAADSPPVIVLEFWPYGLEQCGASVGELLEMLETLVDTSHCCFEVLEWRQSLTALTITDLRSMAFEGGYSAAMKGFTNLLLVPTDRLAEVAEFVMDAPIFG
jgi:FkbM family methyltransferase